VVACDLHPLGNLRVLQHLVAQFGADDAAKGMWSRHWISDGLGALETMLAGHVATGRFCHGDTPTMADACLVPQVYNAVRWKLSLDDYPTIRRIHEACQALEAFQLAVPEAQSDAPLPTL
jgi:maleylacetoacetate isomerase